MPSASVPPWAVRVSARGGKLVGCVEAGGIAVAIRKQRGYANLLLEVLMRNGNKCPARPVDSGTRDIGRATEHAVALAAELAAQAGLAGGEPIVQPPTYGQLLEEIGRRGSNAQNRKSQLRSWMRTFGFVEDDEIGDEFGAALDIYLDKFRAALEAQGKAPSTVGPYLSRIREIQVISQEIRRVEAAAPTFASVLAAAIRASRVPVSRVAEVAGVEKKRVYAWRSGPQVPGPEMRPQITAVEVLLGVPAGTLTELMLPQKATRNAPRTSFAASLRKAVVSSGKKVKELAGEVGCRPNTLFGWMRGGEPGPRNRPVVSLLESSLGLEANALLSRLRPAHLVTLSYIVPLSPSQQEEWERFYVHKTHKAEPDAERRPQEYWRVRADGRCPTGGKVLLDVRRFYGCLSLPVEADDVRHRGLGLPADSLSLVNFALRKHLEFAVNFHAQRSGGFGGAAVMTIHLAASLVREGTGFLSQGHGVDWRSFPVDQLEGQPSNSNGGITLERWRAHCAHLHRFLRQWVDHLDRNKLLKPIRDYRHIESILRLDRPMKVLLLLERRMKKLYARRWARASPNTRARMIRDLIFVSMINRNPLRAEQWQYMTIATVDVPGHLGKESNGHYFLHIPEEEFKAPADFKGRDYEAAIDPELTPLIDDYLANYRPLLIGAGMCNLFLRPSRRWSESHQEDHGEPVNATQLASLLTGTHLLDYATRGFGPHAWRHIIATHLVKNHPESGIRLAARALHNSEDMIRRHYGHLQVRDHTSTSHKIIQAELEIDRAELDRLD